MIGLNWFMLMNSQKLNMMLADEMGLGKTVQVIAFLAYLKESHRTVPDIPHLIVVPSSTLSNFFLVYIFYNEQSLKIILLLYLCLFLASDNWYQEFERWCPTMKVEKYHGPMDERRYLRSNWIKHGFGDIDVVLTT